MIDAISIGRSESQQIRVVVLQHVEEAAHLHRIRTVHAHAAHVRLLHLGRFDVRLAAHLDGIAVAGEYGTRLALQALEQPDAGTLFVVTVRAIEDRDLERLDTVIELGRILPEARAGLVSALGWVRSATLQGITKSMLMSSHPWQCELGLETCAMHAVDPGRALDAALRDPSPGLRVSALRVAGRCGRRDLAATCLAELDDGDERYAFEAARAALLLGDRAESLRFLEALTFKQDLNANLRIWATRLVLKVVGPTAAQSILAALAKDAAPIRDVIKGIAVAGDPHYVSWLIAQMEDLKLARLAGEAFALITGLDLAYLDLERKPPEGVEFGPNDDPADDNVALDEDEGLPWPDPDKIAGWWKTNGARFRPGTRFFMGEVPTPAQCLHVLKSGFQRQRIVAAEYLTLLVPGTVLFNTAAPAWRQQRLLMSMQA